MSSTLSSKRVCVTGGAGFLGQRVCACLRAYEPADIFVPRSREFDLTDAAAAQRMLEAARPEVVIHLAAEVGGIGANQRHPGRFAYANLAMGLNLIEQSRLWGVGKFVLIGTVCSYPKACAVPFREEDLWAGYPEETNAPYGVAKRVLGVVLDAYRAQYGLNGVYLVPVNLYGPGDNFDPETSHVIPGLIRRLCEAADRKREVVTCWGTGQVSREFLYVDDAAEAIARAAALHDDPAPINLGTGQEITIAELAEKIAGHCGYRGRIEWDASRPDGQPRRRLDVGRAAALLNWRAKVDLDEGLGRTVAWWREGGGRS